MRLFRGAIALDIIFVDNNASIHKTSVIAELLDKADFCRMVRHSADLSFGRLGQVPRARGQDKLDLNRFSGYKFRPSSVKGACKSSVPRALNELKSVLVRHQ
ncbi:hypothetical protein TNCV_4611081 [Trichonephila clavipes]|nr:hypothetical protein TNCV_4611081 [Trichonephila clavipes]